MLAISKMINGVGFQAQQQTQLSSTKKYATDDIVLGSKKLLDKYQPGINPLGHVCSVGGGYTGTVSSIHYFNAANEGDVPKPVAMTIVEKNQKAKRCGGLAYGQAGPEHRLNIQASRVPYSRTIPDDCLVWLRERYPNQVIDESSPISREDYCAYLRARLYGSLANAPTGSTLDFVEGEVTSVEESENTAKVEFLDGSRREFDAVLLATGHQSHTELPKFAEKIEGSSKLIAKQYSDTDRDRLLAFIRENPNSTLAIVGSGLSAYDVITTARANGHTGKIYLISRNGHRHFVYREDHKHASIKLPRPECLDSFNEKTTVEDVEKAVLEVIRESLEKLPEELPERVKYERILKAMEPFISEAISKLSEDVTKELLARHKSLLSTYRVGVVPEVGKPIETEIEKGSIVHLKSGIADITENGGLLTIGQTTGEKLDCGMVVLSIGANSSYSDPEKVGNPWKNLIKNGIATAHPLGGVKANLSGQMIGANGQESRRLLVAGVPVSGVATAKRGRTGAFSINTGECRDWSKVVGQNLYRLTQSNPPIKKVNPLV